MSKNKTIIGVINWDASVPSNTYIGAGVTKALSPAKYRTITPYYADVLAEDKIDYHYRTLEEYEIELQYAIDAGIDYFAYCWYMNDEINKARKLHAISDLRHQLKMCAILFPEQDEEFIRTVAVESKESYYQKIDGKPLVYIHGGYKKEFVETIRSAFAKEGIEPYVVFMYGSEDKAGNDYTGADATSAYCCSCHEMTKHSELVELMVDRNEERKGYGLTVIPEYTTGWNPSPRIDNPVPWITYRDVDYPPAPTEEELMYGAKKLVEWIKKNPECTTTGHILCFAWNEFEEGGWICPTFAEDGGIDLSRLEAFRKVADYFREELN